MITLIARYAGGANVLVIEMRPKNLDGVIKTMTRRKAYENNLNRNRNGGAVPGSAVEYRRGHTENY